MNAITTGDKRLTIKITLRNQCPYCLWDAGVGRQRRCCRHSTSDVRPRRWRSSRSSCKRLDRAERTNCLSHLSYPGKQILSIKDMFLRGKKQIKVWLVVIFIDTYLSSARVDAVGCKILHRRVRRGRDQCSDKEASQLHRHQDNDDVRQLPRRHALDDRARHLQAVWFNTKLFLEANL